MSEPAGQQAPRKLPDQSFQQYPCDLTLLEKVEGLIAKYTNGVMEKMGKYEPVPGGDGQVAAGFFPHGVVDVLKASFTAGAGPSRADQIVPTFPSKPAGEKVTVVETSEELTLRPAGISGDGCFPVNIDTHLIVFGNIVRIKGKISLPGKHIVIFAREIKTQADGSQTAELNTDGNAAPDVPSSYSDPAPNGKEGLPARGPEVQR